MKIYEAPEALVLNFEKEYSVVLADHSGGSENWSDHSGSTGIN